MPNKPQLYYPVTAEGEKLAAQAADTIRGWVHAEKKNAQALKLNFLLGALDADGRLW